MNSGICGYALSQGHSISDIPENEGILWVQEKLKFVIFIHNYFDYTS